MVDSPGDEFKLKATPTQEQLRRLLYLATQGNDSVLTGGLRSVEDFGARGEGRNRHDAEIAQLITLQEQARQERIEALNDRLTELDRVSLEAVREAEDRLAEIRRNANRTKDGRLAFEATDGTVRDEHGDIVTADEIDRDAWKPDTDSWEDYREAVDRADEAAAYRRKVEDAKDRLAADPDGEELDNLEARIEELEAGGPDRGSEASWSGPGQSDVRRSTSAAKAYDEPLDRKGETPLQSPFTGAAAGDGQATGPEPDNATTQKPSPPVSPG